MNTVARFVLVAVVCGGLFVISTSLAAPASGPAAVAATASAPTSASAPAVPIKAVVPAKTPRDAMGNMIAAVDTNDKKLFAQTVYMGEGDMSAFRDAMFDSMQVSLTFARKIEQTYGKQPGMNIPSAADLAKLEVKENGDKATADTTPLIKKDGVWMVDMSAGLPPAGPQRDMALKGMQGTVAAINKVMPNIGKPDYTAQKITEELQKEMQALMMKMMTEQKGDGGAFGQ